MTHSLIVYERAPLNAPELARLGTVETTEVRGLQQARSAIERAPRSIVALEVRRDNMVQTAELARWAKSRFPIALIAMPTRSIGLRWDAYLYESGVDLIFRSNLDLHLVNRLIQRQGSRSESQVTDCADISFREQVWQRLPWKRHASGGRS